LGYGNQSTQGKTISHKGIGHRWYLVAQDEKDGRVKNFGFDRITDLKFQIHHI
jgi:hypothetical protein